MSAPRGRKQQRSYVERVLDGDSRIDRFAAEVRAWQAGDQKRPLHEWLGLDADELLLVARNPDALRYLLHARRFGLPVPDASVLGTQERVDAFATQLASESGDVYLLAELEDWKRRSRGGGAGTRAASHA